MGQLALVAQTVKNLPAMQEIWVWSPGWEEPMEKGRATHSSILAWRIPSTLAGYSPWSHKELGMTEQLTLLPLPKSIINVSTFVRGTID